MDMKQMLWIEVFMERLRYSPTWGFDPMESPCERAAEYADEAVELFKKQFEREG